MMAGPLLQTVMAVYLPSRAPLTGGREFEVDLADGDKLLVVEDKHHSWQTHERVLVLCHGLSGCAESKYMIRLSRKFVNEGYCVLRVNLRGCGKGVHLAKKSYHAGRSEDSRSVIRWVHNRYPDAPVTLLGVSLGGNTSLKMAGEDGEKPSGNMDSVIAISPPVDLQAGIMKLQKPAAKSWNKFFATEMVKVVARKIEVHKETNTVDFPKDIDSLKMFDELYTAPVNGFKDAMDYYQQSSSKNLLKRIQIPMLLIISQDDPVVDTKFIESMESKGKTKIVVTKTGGHVGFLSNNIFKGFRWMDDVILKYVAELP